MSTTYQWQVEWMECVPAQDALANVVITAGWRCTASEIVNERAYQASAYGTVSLPAPDPQAFTAYDSLTESQVLAWIHANGVDAAAAEASLATQLQQQITPPTVKPVLPWHTQPPVE